MTKRCNTNSWKMVKALLISALLMVLLAVSGTTESGAGDGLEADNFEGQQALSIYLPLVLGTNDGLVADSFVGAVDEDLFIGIMVTPHPLIKCNKCNKQ